MTAIRIAIVYAKEAAEGTEGAEDHTEERRNGDEQRRANVSSLFLRSSVSLCDPVPSVTSVASFALAELEEELHRELHLPRGSGVTRREARAGDDAERRAADQGGAS